MKIKVKKLGANVARRIMASLVAGTFVFGTGTFAFAASSDASNNNLEVSNTDAGDNHVNAGETADSTENADNNKTTVRNVKNISFLHGGYAWNSSGSASRNTVWVYGDSTIYHIHGGHIGSGSANYNKVYFYSGTVEALTGAGYADSGEANFNELYVYGGTLNGTTQGGYVINDGKANGNTVTIYGGKINGDIYGGYVGGSGEVKNNTVNIYGGDLSNANIYAGYLGGNTNLYGSGNAINFHAKDIRALQVGGFDNIGFYLPNNTQNGDTILTLTGGATDWNNSSVRVDASGAQLNVGDKINLVSNSSGLNLDITNVRDTGQKQVGTDRNIISYGVARDNYAEYNLENGNRELTATIQERVQDIKPQITLLGEAPLSVRGMIDAGTNRILNWLPPEEIEMRNIKQSTPFEVFMGASFESMNIDTGHGSKLRNKSGGQNIGMARALTNRHGIFMFAPITDYGAANYDTTLAETGTRGGGHSKYFTAGLIARQWNNNGMYYEASFRAGKMRTNFTSDNFYVGNIPTHVSYADNTPVYAGHVRIGWRGKISPQNILDVYGIYSHNHVGSIDANLGISAIYGEQHYGIGSSDSKTVRLGARLTRNVNEYNRFYSGLMYQYQFGDDVLTSFEDTSTPKIGVKGSSGMIELGWQLKPTPNSAVMLDSSLVGWIGKQKGLSFQIKLKKDF